MIAGEERTMAGQVRPGERGSALIIALLVMVVMTLLGIPFLLMGETESLIAENELLAVQAVYAAESGALMVKRWFDRPMAASNLINPPMAAIDFSLRRIDADGDPGTAPVLADGSTWPYYKQGRDLDADGDDDVFQKPYRSDLFDTLLGTEDGPDMRIDGGFSPAAQDFLNDLSQELFGGYPSGGHRARITRIDVYAPPTLEQGGIWTRFGVATAKVTAGIYREGGAVEPLAERIAKFVLNEMPYRAQELGALHSCGDLTWDQGFTAHWGVATAKDAADLGSDHALIPASLARVPPTSLWLDSFWNDENDGLGFDAYKAELYADNETIDDPWLRFVSGQALEGAPNSDDQPWPFVWTGGALGDDVGQLPNHLGTFDGSHSAYFQNKTVGCPQFPYETWKTIALRGGLGVHYYAWDLSEHKFRENGMGPALEFRDITDDQDGLFFFDTIDGLPPEADGSNLTPAIAVVGGTWGARGFIYLNAVRFQSDVAAGRPVEFRPPGEPFLDSGVSGLYEGEPFINLDYPTALVGIDSEFKADGSGTPVWNDRGDVIYDDANFWGVFYTSGSFDSRGTATYYGSVIAEEGVDSVSVATGTPDIYWDQGLHENWPPDSWGLPRVAVTHWETDL